MGSDNPAAVPESSSDDEELEDNACRQRITGARTCQSDTPTHELASIRDGGGSKHLYHPPKEVLNSAHLRWAVDHLLQGDSGGTLSCAATQGTAPACRAVKADVVALEKRGKQVAVQSR